MTLFEHQKLALQYLRLNDGFALFMEQGCGKTLPTLCRILELVKSGKIENALVVAPKPVLGAWCRDIEVTDKKTGEPFFKPTDQEILKKHLTIINYDMVWKPNKGFDRTWGSIVVDESHWIKNRTSNRGKFLLKLALKAKYRYILTGTPIGNGKLENIWSQYAFLDPYIKRGTIYSNIFKREQEDRDGKAHTGSYREFEDSYCFLNQYFKPYKYKNVEEVQDIIAEHCYRVTKVECLDLPEKLPDEIYDIELLEPKIYKELHKDSTVEHMDILTDNPLARLAKLRQVCSGFLNNSETVHELKCEKLKVLEDFLDGWEKKLVIFAEFKHSIKGISGLLTKLKIKHVILNGEQKDKQIWRKFQSDESIRVIVCQYQSGGTGIDLYAADTILYFEPTLSSTTLEQSKDRIHRIGQTQKCSYIHFITPKTVEAEIYKALKGYSDFNEKVFTEYMQEYTKSYAGRK